jgi:site-specific DNA-methyltransferase (adenine-specific)
MQTNIIYNEDCIQGMTKIPSKSVKLILTDLPYGMTDCSWDKRLPLPELWQQWNRVLADGGATVLTSIQPFTTAVIRSNIRNFKYCWYWVKNNATGFCFAKYQPMRNVEDICVFYNKAPAYHPQGIIKLDKPQKHFDKYSDKNGVYKSSTLTGKTYVTEYTNYPKQTLQFKRETTSLHPTQKPVTLFEHLIKTYTDPGDVVLDCCIGSGTTAVAAMNTGRRYIGFETDKGYYDTANRRITQIGTMLVQ